MTTRARGSLGERGGVRTVGALGRGKFKLFFICGDSTPLSGMLTPSVRTFSRRCSVNLLNVDLSKGFFRRVGSGHGGGGALPVSASPTLLLIGPRARRVRPLTCKFVSRRRLLNHFLGMTARCTPGFWLHAGRSRYSAAGGRHNSFYTSMLVIAPSQPVL